MRRANVDCTDSDSWRDSVAQPSKVSPWFAECGQRNVLCEHEARAALGDDAGHFGPQVSRVGGSKPLAGDAPRLTGEPAAHDVDSATPRLGVEGSDVVMDWKLRQQSIGLSLLEHSLTVEVDLDGTNASVAK